MSFIKRWSGKTYRETGKFFFSFLFYRPTLIHFVTTTVGCKCFFFSVSLKNLTFKGFSFLLHEVRDQWHVSLSSDILLHDLIYRWSCFQSCHSWCLVLHSVMSFMVSYTVSCHSYCSDVTLALPCISASCLFSMGGPQSRQLPSPGVFSLSLHEP